MSDKCVISSLDNSYTLPLYLYPEESGTQLLPADDDGSAWPLSEQGRRPNLNPTFVREMGQKLGLEFITDGMGDLNVTFGPEDIFHYAYAVFHSPTYRQRYAEFLKIEFPRLPLTSDVELFRRLCALGAELVSLHLMKSPRLSKLTTQFPESGDNNVLARGGYPKFVPGKPESSVGRVYINKTQYFTGVPEAVWDFHVGGYQVLHKWLKDRRGRKLDYQDVQHYQRIVVALSETARIMDEIDDAIPSWPVE